MAIWMKKELMSATHALDPTSKFLQYNKGVFGISIDERTINKGDLFIAFKGNRFDGHNFIDSAIKKGANGILVSDIELAKKYKALFVEDTKKALIDIAKFARKRFQGITIAITGSSGKTSTNHLLYSSLKKFGKTHNTQGNNNNIIGLSLTLSRLPPNYNYCVLELGMNHSNEIEELAKLAKPDLALITNVSNSHIKNFKNEKEIAVAKSEVFTGLSKNSVAIINSDNKWHGLLVEKARNLNINIHLFGHSQQSNTKILKIINEKEGSTIFYDNIKNWHLKYLNRTQAMNAIATISVIKELKLNLKTSLRIISNIKPLSGRGEKLTIKFKGNNKTLIIDDSYNANPDSMKAALNNFLIKKTMLNKYETILIIGDMLELGKYSTKMHLDLIPLIKKIHPNLLITLGKYSNIIANELKSTLNCQSYTNAEAILANIKVLIKPNQLILIKGSNGTGLWKLIPVIKNFTEEQFNAA